MTSMNIIAGIIIIVLGAIIIGIRVYQSSKKNGNKTITMDEFIDSYGDNIVDLLKDTIIVLKIAMSDYETKEEYEEAIISTTIDALKENSVEFGVPEEIVNLLDTEALTSIIQNILNNKKPDCFSVLDSETIVENEKILDKEVVEVLSTATEE